MITRDEHDKLVILAILKYCDRIDRHIKYFGNDYEIFNYNVSFQDAVSMAVEQIGENAKRLSDEFINKHKEIPWHLVRGMRNILTHEYENIDFDEVWNTVINDIPVLREFCMGVIKSYDE